VLHALLSAHRHVDWATILACPACRADVRVGTDAVRGAGCGRRYPSEDDVPIILIEAAELPRGRACQQGS